MSNVHFIAIGTADKAYEGGEGRFVRRLTRPPRSSQDCPPPPTSCVLVVARTVPSGTNSVVTHHVAATPPYLYDLEREVRVGGELAVNQQVEGR